MGIDRGILAFLAPSLPFFILFEVPLISLYGHFLIPSFLHTFLIAVAQIPRCFDAACSGDSDETD